MIGANRSKSIAACFLVTLAAFAPATAHAADAKTCADAFDQGQSLRRDRKLIAAHQQLLICSDQSCPGVIVKDCAQMLSDVEQATPSVVISAKDASGHDAINVRVTSDGKELATSLTGAAMTLDPGVHKMHFEMVGATPVDRDVVVHEGAKMQSVEITLDANPPAPPPEHPQIPAPNANATANDDSGKPKYRVLAYGLGGAGIGSIALGSVFGLLASSSWSTAKNECGAGCAPSSQAYADRSSAKTDATVSTITFIAGGALLAGGAALYFFGPKEKTGVAITATPNGVLLRGEF